MPLFKKKPHVLQPVPRNLRAEEEVFVVRFTREVFRDYDEYISNVLRYRQKMWTCRLTGKTGLTYEEAVASEEQALVKVREFPECYEWPVLNAVHHSQMRLDELVAQVYQTYKESYVPEEEVTATINGVSVRCRVTGINPEMLTQYAVEYQAAQGPVTAVVEAHSIARKKHPLPRSLLKAFIVHACNLVHLGKSSVWVARPEYVAKHELASALPPELEAARAAHVRSSVAKQSKGTTPSVDKPNKAKSAKRQASLVESWGGSPVAAWQEAAATLEGERARMKAGTLKFFCLELLEQAGPAGMRVEDIVATLQARGMKDWSTVAVPRNTVATSLNQDTAFVRVAPARFSLREFHPALAAEQQAAQGKSPPSGHHPHPPPQRQQQQLWRREEEDAELWAAAMRDTASRFDKGSGGGGKAGGGAGEIVNSERCTECRRKRDPNCTPLVLCDNCPRAFHLGCLNMTEEDLPEGDWKCPKCLEKEAYQQARYEEHLRRRAEREQERMQRDAETEQRRQEARDLEAQRLAEREERERQKVLEKEQRERQREEERQRRAAEKEAARKAARYPIDDAELEAEDVLEAQEEGRDPFPSVPPPPHALEGDEEAEGGGKTILDAVPEQMALISVAEFASAFGAMLAPEQMPVASAKELEGMLVGTREAARVYLPLLRALLPPQSRMAGLLTEATWPEVLGQWLEWYLKDLEMSELNRRLPADVLEGKAAERVDLQQCLQELRGQGGFIAAPRSAHVLAVQLLCDQVADTEHVRSLIEKHLEEVEELHRERREEIAAIRREQKAIEEGERDKRRVEREKLAEEKRKAMEEAMERAEGGEGGEEGDGAEAAVDADRAAEEGVKKKKGKKAKDAPRDPEPEPEPEEPNFELDPEIVEYKGNPNDRKALLAHRRMIDESRAKLEREKAAWDKKQSMLKRQAAAKATAEKLREDREQAEAERVAAEAERREAEAKRKKEEAFDRELARRPVRATPLGTDRAFKQYWWFGTARQSLLVFDPETGHWGAFKTRDELDLLMSCLNVKGVRERQLKENFERLHTKICSAMKRKESEPPPPPQSKPRQQPKRQAAALEEPAQAEREREVEQMMLATAVSDMQTIGDKTEGAGAPVDDGWKLWSKAVKAATSVPEAAKHLLQLEEALCSLGADLAPSQNGEATDVSGADAGAEEEEEVSMEDAGEAGAQGGRLPEVSWEWADILLSSDGDDQDPKLRKASQAVWSSAAERAAWRERASSLADGVSGACALAYAVRLLQARSSPMMEELAAVNDKLAKAQVKKVRAAEKVEKTEKIEKLEKKRSRRDLVEDDVAKMEDGAHDRWSEFCMICSVGGDIMCCEGKSCTNVCHMSCAGLRALPKGNWYCSECRQRTEKAPSNLNRTGSANDVENEGIRFKRKGLEVEEEKPAKTSRSSRHACANENSRLS